MSERLRIDLHLHTSASFDCLSDPVEVINRARARGVERIAITDHNTLDQALAMAARFPDQVIPGEEVKTGEGFDVIGLYLSELIPKGTPALETCQRIREQGGIVYLPHPFAPGKGQDGKFVADLVESIDVIEVFNGRLRPHARNQRAERVAEQHRLLVGSGSDAHTLGEVGSCFVDVPQHLNRPAELLRALEHAVVHGQTSHPIVHVASTWAKVRKKLPFGT